MEKLIVGLLGIILGAIVARILLHAEINYLKQRLFESEDKLDVLIDENIKLKKYNKLMSDTLKTLADSKEVISNIPDFDEW